MFCLILLTVHTVIEGIGRITSLLMKGMRFFVLSSSDHHILTLFICYCFLHSFKTVFLQETDVTNTVFFYARHTCFSTEAINLDSV